MESQEVPPKGLSFKIAGLGKFVGIQSPDKKNELVYDSLAHTII